MCVLICVAGLLLCVFVFVCGHLCACVCVYLNSASEYVCLFVCVRLACSVSKQFFKLVVFLNPAYFACGFRGHLT